MSIATLSRPATPAERLVVRRVFETWSIEVPVSFDETFVDENSYWHAYEQHRSVSLTSMVVNDAEGPVRAESMMAVFPGLDGEPVDELPLAVLGSAVRCAATQPARAGRCLQGVLFVDGRILIATITSDDEVWSRRIWLSIRYHPRVPSRRQGRCRAGR